MCTDKGNFEGEKKKFFVQHDDRCRSNHLAGHFCSCCLSLTHRDRSLLVSDDRHPVVSQLPPPSIFFSDITWLQHRSLWEKPDPRREILAIGLSCHGPVHVLFISLNLSVRPLIPSYDSNSASVSLVVDNRENSQGQVKKKSLWYQ